MVFYMVELGIINLEEVITMVYVAYNVVTGVGFSSTSRRSLNKRVMQWGTAGRWVFSRKTIATVAPGFLEMVEKNSREN